MSPFDIATLSNGIRLIIKKNPNTPRIAVNIFADSGIKYESKSGLASLTGRLLLQGTKTRSSEALANELDTNAIELNVDTKQDYTKIKALFLNEDFDKSLDIMADIIKNSTFENFEKEARKLKGEIEVDLDSPRLRAVDNLIKNIFPNHPYGHTHTKILEDLAEITPELVKDFYYSNFLPSKMSISIVGDIEKDSIIKAFEAKLGDIQKKDIIRTVPNLNGISENKIITIHKSDVAQAQIVQGWLAPEISDKDFPVLSILNIILGSSGLSSRLFVELRDKKGLAYHVSSSYEALEYSGIFSVYIGTAPINVTTAIEGFNIEIKKLQEELVPDKELEDAKNNYLGKRVFYHETNAQQAHYLGYYDILGLGAGYDEKIAEQIKKITAQDIKEAANKYLSQNSITSMLIPE